MQIVPAEAKGKKRAGKRNKGRMEGTSKRSKKTTTKKEIKERISQKKKWWDREYKESKTKQIIQRNDERKK